MKYTLKQTYLKALVAWNISPENNWHIHACSNKRYDSRQTVYIINNWCF